jgi:hypothetical protein
MLQSFVSLTKLESSPKNLWNFFISAFKGSQMNLLFCIKVLVFEILNLKNLKIDSSQSWWKDTILLSRHILADSVVFDQ